ncbi:MAG: helix-turn-helix domain-containing protein [Alteromonadaceae bacterium]|nr:helix-turn-helix domain-containing protein [Alteromonadaceae bacterium]
MDKGEERLATFLLSLSTRYHARSLSSTEFRLAMTCSDIGNYISLTVETISRFVRLFHVIKCLGFNKYKFINGIGIT